jgi:hypothetical protein
VRVDPLLVITNDDAGADDDESFRKALDVLGQRTDDLAAR